MKVDEIGSTDFQQYWLWRKENYSKRVPSNATLGRERTAILSLFKFAVQMGHIAQTPDSTAPKSNGERRPTFTEQEWEAVLKASEPWVKEGKQKSTGRDRFVAMIYFLVISYTGLRVGELRKLTWGDFRPIRSKEGNYVVAEVRGKTGGREVVCQGGTGQLLNKLISLRAKELEVLYPDCPSSNDLGLV